MRYRGTPGWATLLLLGMLFLRALVPAGFMLAPVDGALAVVLCEPGLAAAAHLHHSGHDHAGHEHAAHHHGAHADPTCPYAQSAGPSPLPTLPALAGGGGHAVVVLPVELAQTLLRFGPTRQQSPRGPPALV